jgi:hypothetical protein
MLTKGYITAHLPLPASKKHLVNAVEASVKAGTPTTEGIAAQLANPVDV